MFRHRERFVKILIFVLVGAMVLSTLGVAVSAIFGG
jgi:hypothetical protein